MNERISSSGYTVLVRAFGLALVLVLAACGGGGAATNEETASPDDAEQATPDSGETAAQLPSFDFRFGMVMDLTGDLGAFGPSIEAGALLGVPLIEEAIAEAGLEGQVSIVHVGTEDGQTDPQASVQAATKLVQADDADVIIGPLGSEATVSVAQAVTIPEGIVQITPSGTSPSITDLEDGGFVWRTAPSDLLAGRVIAQAMQDEFGLDTVVNLGARNDTGGIGQRDQFANSWEEAGGSIGESVLWDPKAATFDTEAQQLVQGSPGAWFLAAFAAEWNSLGPALVRTGEWDPSRTFTIDAMRDPSLVEEVGEEATLGIRGVASTVPESDVSTAFDELYAENVEVEQQIFEAQAFDALMVSFLAAVAAGSSEPAEIAVNLQEVSGGPGTEYTFEELNDAVMALVNGEDINYQGVSGPVDFDENGDPGSAVYEIWEFTEEGIESTGTVTLE